MSPPTPTEADVAALTRRVAERLRDRGETLGVAESETGGAIGAALTALPGASDYFRGGVVAYGYGVKRRALGVDRETLDEAGTVSAPVAREMARGIRDRLDVTWGVATTGIAGPTGRTDRSPVGTVYVGVAYAAPWETGDSYATARRYALDGDRAAVREATVRRALADLLAEVRGVDAED